MPKILLITGPSSVGKTQLIYEIARRKKNAEVINGDKFFFYKEFNLGTGVSDSLKNTDVEKHLYQILDPFDSVPSALEYAELAKQKVAEVSERDNMSLMEVYPFSYVKRMSEEKEITLFGLVPSREVNLEERIRRRINILLEQGLISETESAIQRGYRHTFVMENAAFYRPLVRFLDGLVSLDEAIDEMVSLCLGREKEAFRNFQDINSIKWIIHNSSEIESSIKKILSWL